LAKIPAPTIPPITIIVASNNPSCFRDAVKPLGYHRRPLAILER
jgi:hypothetical protein